MRNGWDTALDAQTDLIRSFQTREGRDYLYEFAESLGKTIISRATGERSKSRESDRDHAHRIVNAATYMITAADPIYVSDELADLINYAAAHPTYQPDTLRETDLLVPAGFAWFDHPIEFVDTHGSPMLGRACQWCVTEWRDKPDTRGILLAMYAHKDDPDPYEETHNFKMTKVGGSDLALSHVTTFKFEDPQLAEIHEPSIQMLYKHILVFFRLMQQEIAVPGRERAARPVWKRAATWRQIKEVVVYTLRRAKEARYEGPEREVRWTHRWMVGAHWHTYHYKDGSTKQKWIAPYVKGPDDKPLIVKKRAFEVVR